MVEDGYGLSNPKSASSGRGNGTPVVHKVTFPPLPKAPAGPAQHGIPPVFRGVTLTLNAELGKTTLKVRELINLGQGSLLKLDRLADESVALLVNEVPFAQGEVVVINDRFAVRVISFTGETKG